MSTVYNNNNKEFNSGNEIDISNLPNQTVWELKEIASSLGIAFKSSTKKDNIIEMIESVYNRKRNKLVKQKINSNLNSFNKGVIEFNIKDGIDPLEWLFWKLFRNKFIYKKIMSNMEKRITPDYDSIFNVIEMINKGQFGMLRDKVIRNQYLVFNNQELYVKDLDATLIFKSFKNNDDQDRLFYQQLFKYYNRNILEFNAIKTIGKVLILDGTNDREGLVNKMIATNCLPALQILIEQYQYYPTELNLKNSINNGSIKFIKLILQHQPQLKESIRNILLNNNKEQTLSTFKSLYWLHYENMVDITTSTIIQKCIESNKINEKISLKLLIIICKLSKSINTGNITCIKEIETFSNSLTNKELKLPISDASFQIQYKKDNILKLLSYYYSITNIEPIPEFYYLYFKCNGTDYGQTVYKNVKFEVSNLINQFIQSLQFANFTLFKHCFENGVKKLNYISTIERIEESIALSSLNLLPFIFSHCPGDENKEKRLEFINSFINHFQQKQETIQINFMSPVRLLLFLVDYNDLELVKKLSLLGISFFTKNGYYDGIKYIKSIEMFDYLYLNFKQLLFTDVNIYNFKSIQLLKHYESLVSNITLYSWSHRSFLIINSPNELIQHIIESGPSIYQFTTFNDIYTTITEICTTGKLEMMKLLFMKFQLEPDISKRGGNIGMNINGCGSSYTSLKFKDWLFVNHQNYLKNDYLGSCVSEHYQNGVKIDTFYGRLNELNENISINTILHNFSIDIKSLDFICNKLKIAIDTNKINGGVDDINIKKCVCKFFEELGVSCVKGNLKLFENIQQNHSWVLNFKKGDTNSIIPDHLKELKQLLFTSLCFGQLLLSDFFFEFIIITKKEFNCNSNELSKVYFKDKKFK